VSPIHFQLNQLSRRSLLRRLLSSAGSAPFALGLAHATTDQVSFAPEFSATDLSKEEEQLLEDMERANFKYFWEQANPQTGLVKDRCDVREPDRSTVASIAATGFGLTALCIGQQREYVPLVEARERVLKVLHFLWEKMPNHRGFFYHFANPDTGERTWDSEISSIDTALLLCGVLTCRQHFRGNAQIAKLSSDIFNRVEWTWLSEDTDLLPHGWSPEGGFLPYRWDYYSELMMMYLLGLGSVRYPLPPGAWKAWKRRTFEYQGLQYIGSFAPLFVHQYSQAWFDFRGKRDEYVDYFKNSIIATEVHRRFCLALSKKFPNYSEDLWGITASDSEHGYVVWGGPPETGPIDGTVVPSAPAGSLPFMPRETLRVLRTMRTKYERSWTQYGFVNAFNPLTNWYDSDVIGIDTGISMLMAENLRTRFVWETFMKNPEAQRGLDRAGFTSF
jgi:hypothetical protein